MTFILPFRRVSAAAPSTITRGARLISSFSHFTPAEFNLLWEHIGVQTPKPILQGSPHPQHSQLQTYCPKSLTWVSAEKTNSASDALLRGNILKIVSWNIYMTDRFDPALRASAALDHLQELFGTLPGHLIVMLREVVQESLQAILDNPWVQQNFTLTNSAAPESVYDDIHGDSFVYKDLYWQAAPYFTLMLIAKSLAVSNCLRVPFVSNMGRDALCVDVPISTGKRARSKTSIRLCTTHLESLWAPNHRSSQLAMISTLLKGPETIKSGVIAGLVGGDMNASDRSEHDLHKAHEIDLKDVWEDIPPPHPPKLKPFQKDMTYGRARGNTWGYQSDRAGNRKRLDKFFYTGQMETVALTEPQDVTGKLGRLGIGL